MDTQGRPSWITPAKPKLEKFVFAGAMPLRSARVLVILAVLLLAPVFSLVSHDVASGLLVVVGGIFALIWLEMDAKPWQPPR